MRRYQKKELLELCNTLGEGLDYIEQHCQNDKGVLTSLCADCQDCAIAVGNTIESIVGEGTDTVTAIENLCEQLYLLCTDETDGAFKKHLKTSRELLIKIIHGIKYELLDAKLEILFLPYKASMWTALESIWKAAIGYDECNVTVMPLPYYKLYMKDEKAEFAYEGNEFPEDVPVVHYTEYDIEKMRPDMIFIHNPYDATNTLTRIPDQYHSVNLKKHTGMLVYSPYANFGAFNPVTHPFMCQTNALQYVDYVITQSKKVAKLYSDAGVDKEKLLTFGSPKADAIVNKLKDKQPLPEEWERKLKERKVFLINVSLSFLAMWRNRENKKEKPAQYSFGMLIIKSILTDISHRKEFGLIWRPHPLFKDMLRSRGLTIESEFIEQMEQLIEESENMVIDKNADYVPAFQRSDAFYTTYTSMIPEYMITGKPIALFEPKYRFLEDERQPVSYLNNYFITAPQYELPSKNHIYRKDLFEIVRTGLDARKEGRLEDARKGFGNLDGDSGIKIFGFLMDKMSL